MSLEAKVINSFSEQIEYDWWSKNCNTSTRYFANKYLNGVDVFANWGISDLFIGEDEDFVADSSHLKRASAIADSFISSNIDNFNYDNITIDVSNNDFALIGDGLNTYKVYGGYVGLYLPNANAGNGNVIGSNGDDTLGDGYNYGNNYINGGAGNDTISGGYGDDKLYGGAGDDLLHDLSNNNIFSGGTGNDTINGGSGNDTYIWNLGDGLDMIYDTGTYDNDKIVFGQGISFNDLSFQRDGGYLLIFVNGRQDQGMKIRGFDSSYPINKLEFFDGSMVDLSTVGMRIFQTDANDIFSATAFDDVIYGNGGNDTIRALGGNDIIYGGAGDDILEGSGGNDTYVYNLGDGFDTIKEASGTDRISLGFGIEQDDVQYVRSGKDLLLVHQYTPLMKIEGYFNGSSYQVEQVEFSNGNVVNLANAPINTYLTANADSFSGDSFSGDSFRDVVYGGAGNDNISGAGGDDIIYGDADNDTLNGGNGNDALFGGDGIDILNGDYDNDILVGGIGNDDLKGGYGDDTYVYMMGDGFDKITESDGLDTISFGEGITTNNLSFAQSGKNLNIYVNSDTNQGVSVSNFFRGGSYKVEALGFANGTVDISTCNSVAQLIQTMAAFGVQSSVSSLSRIEDDLHNPNPMLATTER